jgi:hypothetical protein
MGRIVNGERRDRALLAAMFLAGAALLLWQYLGRASLWLDEVAVAFNLLGRSATDLLTRPLQYDQVAPAGFLLATKIATRVFGDGELALRLIPLLAALLSLPLFALVARRLVPRRAALFAMALFALGIAFIRYGGELKPYSCDVAAALALTLAADRLLAADGPAATRRAAATGLLGVVAVIFSNAAVFVLAGLGVALVAESLLRRERRLLQPLAFVLAWWTLSAAMAWIWAHRVTTEPGRVFLRHFWSVAFPILTLRHRFGIPFFFAQLSGFWGPSSMEYGIAVAFALLSLVGLADLVRERRASALLLIAPIGVTFAAAALQLYPFDGRLILFLGPALVLGAGTALSLLADLASRLRIPPAVSAAVLLIPCVIAIAEHPPVYSREEPRLLIGDLARRRRPADPVYVFYGASPAMRFYGPRVGIDPSGVALGECHRGDLAAYLRELDQFRGSPRVWVLVLHHQRPLREQATIRAYLDQIGRRLEGTTYPEDNGESTLDLYDLTDPGRLASARADTFPLPSYIAAIAARLGCGNGPH